MPENRNDWHDSKRFSNRQREWQLGWTKMILVQTSGFPRVISVSVSSREQFSSNPLKLIRMAPSHSRKACRLAGGWKVSFWPVYVFMFTLDEQYSPKGG